MSDSNSSQKREIPRRTFIATVIGSVVGFSILGWWRFRAKSAYSPSAVAAALQDKLPFLDLEPAGVERFAQDVDAVMSRIQISPSGELIEPPGPVIEGLAFQLDPGGAIRFYQDTVVRKFLLSSDFFLEGADESKTVHYLGWFDEFGPCRNPFAVLD